MMLIEFDLQTPMAEAQAIVHRRFPVPRLVDCDQNGSQARIQIEFHSS